ncbi:glycosyltransferase family 4 protein [Undibacterium luofuense]|uniref:Glycosyltransferase family 4 protein n=1 Tax=Undibacterium luofuense TaxID=2828733 RepID=A0A941DQ96_9BURK|nr:glycosyltransferase family 4 protein [Undibacterium luofuense]MBR7784199.1 glycosyltransferase family 4 protein [Undibacterium luofuense]
MRITLIADTFPPLRTSGAVQLRDLTREFVRQGHSVLVLLPAPGQRQPWKLEEFDGAQVLRLKAPRTKDIDYVRRTLAELVMPFVMLRNLRKSPLAKERSDAVVWYAPSIFHGPLVRALTKSSRCKSYLVIRDIFPEWAVDMGLMGRGLPYRFFDAVARYQYSVADVIGVQTPGNQRYFDRWMGQPGRKLEVLQNWLDKPAKSRCPIRVDEIALAGRKVFVYAGNMGVAQGMDILLDLAERLRSRLDVGFLFVGRGSDSARLKAVAQSRQLENVVFFDEIYPDEIPDLYAQCDAGIVALDPRHKSHNIPGKFLTYMQSGLPVLANINAGNDLAQLIRDERVGQVCETNQVDELLLLTEKLLDQIETDSALSARCTALFEREFAVENTVKQIVAALSETAAARS